MALAPGTRLESYEIVAPIGHGGMGEVYRARDLKLDRSVAVKVLSGGLGVDAERLRRFEREARSASALNHPNIVHIYDVGESDGVHFIAMELVEGTTLRRLLADAAITAEDAADIAVQIAEGLAKAHARGIVHRDLKPENVMRTTDGLIKILDFGLAKLQAMPFEDCGEMSTIAPLATRPGSIMGTIEYMSPEQAGGQSVDHRTDQFSLGSILYEMATGRLAFHGPSPAQTLAAIIEREPAPIATLTPSFPPHLVNVVERCMAKRPDERFASTAELVAALRTASQRVRAESSPPVTAVAASPLLTPRRPEHASVERLDGPFEVQKDGRAVIISEQKLRRRLRRGSYTGMELMRRGRDEPWQPMHSSAVFRDEVPHGGDSQSAARWRAVKGFYGHFSSFVGFGIMMSFMNHGPPPWLGFWAMGVMFHGLGVLPAGLALIRDRKRGPSALPIGDASAQLPAPPISIETSVDALPSTLRAELTRVRALLERRGGDGYPSQLAEIDRLERAMAQSAARRKDLEEQTSATEEDELRQSVQDAERALESATSAQDRRLLKRQREVIRVRLEGIEKGRRLVARLGMRLALGEHQMKQLRLDLTRAEATSLTPPELSSRLENIRHEVDASEEVDELFADG